MDFDGFWVIFPRDPLNQLMVLKWFPEMMNAGLWVSRWWDLILDPCRSGAWS